MGVDIVSVKRISNLLELYGERFLLRVFTEREILYAKSKNSYVQTLAGKFAAKESVIKLSGKFIPFQKIEILNNDKGIPCVVGNDNIMISISHEREFAVAVAVEVKDENSTC
ncbi:MAG: holo-ACP synthase [Caldisericaceae bacterium]